MLTVFATTFHIDASFASVTPFLALARMLVALAPESPPTTLGMMGLTVGDVLQSAVAVGTLVLAGATWWLAQVTARGQMEQREQLRLGQEPRVWPVSGGGRLYNRDALGGTVPPLALRVENLGRGPAFTLQWEVNFAVPVKGSTPLVARAATYLQRLSTHREDVGALWRLGATGDNDLEVVHGMLLSLGYDDSAGNHYLSRFSARGDKGQFWLEEEFTRILERPEPFFFVSHQFDDISAGSVPPLSRVPSTDSDLDQVTSSAHSYFGAVDGGLSIHLAPDIACKIAGICGDWDAGSGSLTNLR